MTQATLSRFEHTSPDNTLRYNLSITVPVRNPNKWIGVYYDDRIEAHAYYDGKRFSSTTLTPFYQGHKNTTVLRPVFQGQNLVIFNTGESRTYIEEMIAGVYEIEIKFRLRARFKLGDLKTRRIKPKVNCDDLRLPLSTLNGTTTFSTILPLKCDFDFKSLLSSCSINSSYIYFRSFIIVIFVLRNITAYCLYSLFYAFVQLPLFNYLQIKKYFSSLILPSNIVSITSYVYNHRW